MFRYFSTSFSLIRKYILIQSWHMEYKSNKMADYIRKLEYKIFLKRDFCYKIINFLPVWYNKIQQSWNFSSSVHVTSEVTENQSILRNFTSVILLARKRRINQFSEEAEKSGQLQIKKLFAKNNHN